MRAHSVYMLYTRAHAQCLYISTHYIYLRMHKLLYVVPVSAYRERNKGHLFIV